MRVHKIRIYRGDRLLHNAKCVCGWRSPSLLKEDAKTAARKHKEEAEKQASDELLQLWRGNDGKRK